MEIDDIKIYEGRNIYSHRKCIKFIVDLKGYSDIPSKDISGFNEKIVNQIPELNLHKCCLDYPGGFCERLMEGTYIAHICEHVIIALQNILGLDVSYGKARKIEGEIYCVVFEYLYKQTGLACGRAAVELINSLIYKKPYNFEEDFCKIKSILKNEQIGASTEAIIHEAKKRNIPCLSLGSGSLFQLGYGKTSRIVEATITSNTSAISVDIACDKYVTKELLSRQCLPVSPGGIITSSIDLISKAERMGYPVVLKPRYGNQGKGVFVNIKNSEELLKIYDMLRAECEDIIIEKHVDGKDYRILIVDGKFMAASERIPPYVIGDGKSSIVKLIQVINSSSKRGEGHEKPLTKIKIDQKLIFEISKKGYNLDCVLRRGERLKLKENANLSTGGIAVDCTDIVAEENKDICVRCAKAIGLDVCGIDICCENIKKPIKNSGYILEVNAAPGIRMHHYPDKGKERNAAAAIVDMLFKNMKKSIPVISITGTNGKTTTTRLIGHILRTSGLKVGMTNTGGIYIDNKCIEKGDTTGYESATAVLLNRTIDAAVLECARGGIIRKGLAYDLADVGVITNITEDHLGMEGIESLEDLAQVKSLVVEAVKDDGYAIINADDPMSLTILDKIKSKIIMFSKDKENKNLRNNIISGGVGVYSDQGIIIIESNDICKPVVRVDAINITLKGKLIYNVENALAACAACVALNLDIKIIKRGLTTFFGDEEQNPGRFNIYHINNATVILDYGHNIEGYKAVINGAKQIRHKRFIGIIGVPGDRTNKSICEIGGIAGNNFDYIYIKEDKDRRGRKKAEVSEMLMQGALANGFDAKKINVILDEKEALKVAIDKSLPGDLIIIFFEKREPLLKIINDYKIKLECIAESYKVV